MRDVPVHVGVIWPTSDAARDCPRGDIELALCPHCELITNVAFDPAKADYSARYDNALHFSAVFRDYEASLADSLVGRYDLRAKHVVEIGCGSGHFLGLLCAAGDNRGTGFDPSHDPRHADPMVGERVRVTRAFYGPEHAALGADFVCARHVLEHVPDPARFLATVRAGVAGNPDAVVYCEVPNGDWILRAGSVWDVIYEHVLYFTAPSLAWLFRECGFAVLDVREAYDGQFLALEARSAATGPGALPAVRSDARERALAFGEQIAGLRSRWTRSLQDFAAERKRVVVWGGGAKAVTFLNMIPDTATSIHAVTDVNPGKQGSFIAGTGHRIVAPEVLPDAPPDVVVVMNPVYRTEIERHLGSLGLAPLLMSV